jgi:hypothetical protein
MRQLILLLGALALLLGVSGSAGGASWEVVYDLGLGGSQLTTLTPFGPKVDPVTGTFTIEYDANPRTGPISGARLVAGHPHTGFNQIYTGFFIITGFADTTLLPPTGGAVGTINGATLTMPVIADSNATGYNHCVGIPASATANCALAGFTQTVNNPLTPASWPTVPNTWVMPKLQFASAVGVGDFTSTTKVSLGSGATLKWVFKGKEVSRIYHADVPAVSNGGLVGLGIFLLVGATSTFALRRGRRK